MDEKQSQMKASDEILSKKELIKQILTNNPQSRDSDRHLCISVWTNELTFDEDNYRITKWNLFASKYLFGELTSADSISRLKRLIQREHPELRGIDKSEEEQNVRELFTGELNFPNS